ncbi:MAG: LysR family transcriptional regulator [Polyangiaceae bacterium]|nr:LysR family transcriptional regulator [Polyangiaceae bacterium]
MLDGLGDIPVFVAVVETGGFSAAARRLAVTRSAVGKAIARLEERLGARLLHRSTRRQTLTRDGQTFYEHCQRAMAELSAGTAQVESGRGTVRGRLKVSMAVLFGRLCVAPTLMRLAAKHPELDLELSFCDRPVDLVEDGFDLAVRNGPVGQGSGLTVRRIARERTFVFASAEYLARHGEPATLAELADHRAVVYARGGRIQRWLFPVDEASPIAVAPPARFRFDDLEAIADAAVAGIGLAWLPTWLVRDRIRSGALVQILREIPGYQTDVHAIWPETTHLGTRVRVAIDALAAEVPRVAR